MPLYRVDSGGSRVETRARSSIHDTTTRWGALRGEIEATPESLAAEGARARFTVDMSDFDAGDWLKNRKLKKDLELDRHPEAVFELDALEEVEQREDGTYTARARGRIRWREREAEVVIDGSARLDESSLEARGRFELDVTRLGVTPPRFLMFKVEETVEVDVELSARPAP